MSAFIQGKKYPSLIFLLQYIVSTWIHLYISDLQRRIFLALELFETLKITSINLNTKETIFLHFQILRRVEVLVYKK